MLDLSDTTSNNGFGTIQQFSINCVNAGYDSFVENPEKHYPTGHELCKRLCSNWRHCHAIWATQLFHIGYSQAELDKKIESGATLLTFESEVPKSNCKTKP